jgi:hypothetical protein
MPQQSDFSRYAKRHLSERALKRVISGNSLYSFEDFIGGSYEAAGRQIAQSRPLHGAQLGQRYLRAKKTRGARKSAGARRPSPNYWGRVRDEIHKLACTSDPRYASLRRELTAHSGKTQTAIVGVIAAYVASVLGLATGAVVPLVAVCLIALLRVGKNAFCDGFQNVQVK